MFKTLRYKLTQSRVQLGVVPRLLLCLAAILFTISSIDRINAQTISLAKTVHQADLYEKDGNTHFEILFDGKPDYRLFFMVSPNRFVLEIDGVTYTLDGNKLEKPKGVITSVRYGNITQQKSRMVASLANPSSMIAHSLQKSGESNNYRLEIVLGTISAIEFNKMVENQKAVLGTSGEAIIKGDRVRSADKQSGRFTIVIDPGHGGIDGGSSGKNGAIEKNITLSAAKLIGQEIEKSGPFDVYYTRDTDVFVSLKKRRKFARRHQANLLLSIHADSLKQKHVRGATLYTLAKKASDALAKEIATSENLSDLVAGLAAPDAQDEVTDILRDLTLRETTIFSRDFSNRLANQLNDKVKLINNPQRSASFLVLKNAEVPGVLLELGYLSNSEDEKLLQKQDWQQLVAQSTAAAVRDFFSIRISNSN